MVAHMERQAEERRQRMAERMIERLDQDGDGTVDAEELAARGEGRHGGMLRMMDADWDGAVTEAEFDAARERMEDRRGGRGDHHRGDRRSGHHGMDMPRR
ncbi:penta-EF hand family protein [Roseitranquillus sediminis]|uniref:hypothetical protein n=1 Tax=Roseitranquillus sediminis TaxID=2809051 RepID=UPI00222267D6|nr:hypothetical protein [Roseitranquillus sediminis]